MKRYKEILSAIILVICFLYFYLTSNIKGEHALILASTLVEFIKTLGFLIIPLSKYVQINSVVKCLLVYIGCSGVISLTALSYIFIGGWRNGTEILITSLFLVLMESIGFYKVIKSKDKVNDVISYNVVMELSLLMLITVLFFEISNLGLNIDTIRVVNFIDKILSILVYCWCFITFKRFTNNKSEFTAKKYVELYLVFKILYTSLYIITYEINNLIAIKIILLLCSGFFIGKILYVSIISKPNKTLYHNLVRKNEEFEAAVINLKKYSKVIEEDNEHINSLLNAFPESVGIFENNKLVFANNKWKELFNCFDENNLIGTVDINFVREDYREQLLTRLQTLKTSKNNDNDVEYIFNFNGHEFIGECTSTLISRGEKEIGVVVVRDVTKKKLIESLNKTIEYNEKENKLRNELLTNLSHEFKTPINVIYSAIQMQDLYYKSEDINGIFKFNSVMKQNCLRLLRLINNFIDITNFESELEIKSNMQTINIVPLVEDIVTSVISYGNKNNISIIFDTENEEIYGEFDPEMMDRIMLNLLSNAIKYNVEGGQILVDISETEKNIVIYVQDTGVGISEENIKKLYNRFERVDKSLSRKREGTGIGLNIVKSLVEHQKGIIDIESRIGVGTTFSLIFPRLNVDVDSVEYIDSERNELINKVSLELSDII